MALTEERLGDIAQLMMSQKMTEDGVHLKPKQVRRDVFYAAKKLGIPPHELAEFVMVGFRKIFDQTIFELKTIITESSDKVKGV